MSRIKLDKDRIAKRLRDLTLTAVCIQRTSKYLFQFYKSADIIVNLWYQTLCSVNSDQLKVSLFYVANEMLQSKNYGLTHFKQSWKNVLIDAVDVIRDTPIIDKAHRIFNIWIERKVYEKSFIEKLIGRLSTVRSPKHHDENTKQIISSFDPEEAVEKLRNVIKADEDVDEMFKNIDVNSVTFDEKSFKDHISKLKDKAHCNDFGNKLDIIINKLFKITSILEEELNVLQLATKIIANADIYYDAQLSETVIVEDAYRRYGNLISKTKTGLEEHIDFLLDDCVPIDVDDAPSPGKTPPHLYDVNEPVSPTQSMDMSEDESPVDNSQSLEKPYSPSHLITTTSEKKQQETNNNEKVSLSSSDALKLLTSVFSQSLTKKPTESPEKKINLPSDMFRNTLATTNSTSSDLNDTVISSVSTKSNTSVIADALKMISNLTGLKTINERTFKSEQDSSGTSIPTLTSKMSHRNSNDFDKSKLNFMNTFNQSNMSSTGNILSCDNLSQSIYSPFPTNNNTFPNAMFSQPPMPTAPMFPLMNTNVTPVNVQPNNPSPVFNPLNAAQNPLTFALNTNNRPEVKTPGSCTEDEDDGSATPTQDEPSNIKQTTNIFNPSIMPPIGVNNEEFSKQIQNAMNVATNAFTFPNLLANQKDLPGNHNQNTQWNMNNQYPFNLNSPAVQTMNMPFSLMSQSAPLPPMFNSTNNNINANKFIPNSGPPRAIRKKRPNSDLVADGDKTEIPVDLDEIPGESQTSVETGFSTPVTEGEKSIQNDTKTDDKESEVYNLYADVEEEFERNQLTTQQQQQQNINVRNTRPPPPSDRYHLYNNRSSASNNINFRYGDPVGNSFHRFTGSLPSHNNNLQHYPRNQFHTRGGMTFFPNRSMNFRPRYNFNMFN